MLPTLYLSHFFMDSNIKIKSKEVHERKRYIKESGTKQLKLHNRRSLINYLSFCKHKIINIKLVNKKF